MSPMPKCYAKWQYLEIIKILVTCTSDNIGSIKTILTNGGIFENEILNECGEKVKKFWIHCENKSNIYMLKYT